MMQFLACLSRKWALLFQFEKFSLFYDYAAPALCRLRKRRSDMSGKRFGIPAAFRKILDGPFDRDILDILFPAKGHIKPN